MNVDEIADRGRATGVGGWGSADPFPSNSGRAQPGRMELSLQRSNSATNLVVAGPPAPHPVARPG
jgi:hypothetical protein